MEMSVIKVKDFDVTGSGDAAAWSHAQWHSLQFLGGTLGYLTRAKVLYSDSGIYFLVDNEDSRLNCTLNRDFGDLFKEDVVEVFLWPDTAQRVYFEYEISPLGKELPIMVCNSDGHFHGWLPWHYEGARCTRRAVSVRGGPQEPGAAVTGWTAEFYIPFNLLTGLGNVPPSRGTVWRGNIYRIDYDAERASRWGWSPGCQGNFHDVRKFGTLVFA
jgi:hypothetical protein